jgi:hypothetical protein
MRRTATRLRLVQTSLVTTRRTGTRRRIAWLLAFWAVWTLLIALANVYGLVDATLSLSVAH